MNNKTLKYPSNLNNKFFFDTEFVEAGPGHPVRLISIGIVHEDGNEYYAIDANCNYSKASKFVIEEVLPHLDMKYAKDRNTIKEEIYSFVIRNAKPGIKPEFWSYYADYDWVVFAQIFGTMVNIPHNFPRFCMDIKQYAMRLGNPQLPESDGALHNALEDAKYHKKMYDFLVEYEKGLK